MEIEQKLAATGGSSARVYSVVVDGWFAFQWVALLSHSRTCAMKELRLDLGEGEVVDAFEKEINVLEQLPFHPNIVRYLYHERTGDTIRLFMQRLKYAAAYRLFI